MPAMSHRVPGIEVAVALGVLLGFAARPLEGAKKPAPPRAPSRIERLGRVLELEDTRSEGAGELERLLLRPDRGIRRRSALAAGRIADRALVPALVELMNDPEAEVRQMAAFALGLIGDRAAVERLVASLGDPEPLVRGRAAEALGRIGDPRAAAEIARFVRGATPPATGRVTVRGDDPGNPSDPWAELRLGLFALARLKDPGAAAAALLARGEPRFDWWAATWVAMRLESALLQPVLVAAAASDDAWSRALAARGLGTLKDPAAGEMLARLARDRDETVVVAALGALGALGDAGGTAVAARQLDAAHDVVRHEALLALAALPPERRLRARLADLVGDRDPWIRAAALGALAHTDREDFALVLSGLDPDPVWSVRAALARTLGGLGDPASVAILHSMLADEDPRVLPAVLEALRRARGRDALDTLRRHLEHEDAGVRVAAAEGIADMGAVGLAPELLSSWRRDLGPGDLEPRLAVVDALAAQADEVSREALLTVAVVDPSRAVRARASAALRERGVVPSPDPGEEAVIRPPLDYRNAMAPYDPVPGVALYTPRAFLRTSRGTIEIHLDVIESPLAAASFVQLVQRGFFDGLIFHLVEPGFLVQGGSPRGDGYGGPGYVLRDEITHRPFGRGAVGLALAGRDTGGSQFFITLQPQPQLDGVYTRFGIVVSGMEVVDAIRPGDTIERASVWTGE